MKKLNDHAFEGAKAWLTNLYDNFHVPEALLYRDQEKNIEFLHAPRTNIIGMSSQDWFFDNLRGDDSTGGFLPRWLLFSTPGHRLIPKPKNRSSYVAKHLAEAIRQIAAIPGGPVQFFDGFEESGYVPNSAAPYNVWYVETARRFSEAHAVLGAPFFQRLRGNVLKLAVVYEASMSRTLRVTPKAWEHAFAKAREMEAILFEFFHTGMTPEGKVLADMEHYVQAAGRSGITQEDFAKRFKNTRDWRKQRDQLVQEIRTIEKVQGTPTGKRGRDGFPFHFLLEGNSGS